MITHIVFWKLLRDDEHNAEENAARIRRGLEGLVGIVPGLLSAEVGEGLDPNGEFDLCLVSTFENRDALAAYRTHPEHVKVQTIVHAAICRRTALDFESQNDMDPKIDPYVF